MYRISPQKHHKCYTNASEKCRGDKVEQGKQVEKNIFAFGAPPPAAAGVVGSHFWEENLRIFSSLPRGVQIGAGCSSIFLFVAFYLPEGVVKLNYAAILIWDYSSDSR